MSNRIRAWKRRKKKGKVTVDGKQLSFLFLPQGEDPDTFVRKFGKEAFENSLREAKPLSQFLLDELKSQVDIQTPEGRAKLLQEAAPRIKQIADWIGTMDWIATASVFLVWCGDMRRGQRLCEMHHMPHANNNMDTFLNTAVDCALAMAQFMAARIAPR